MKAWYRYAQREIQREDYVNTPKEDDLGQAKEKGSEGSKPADTW